MVTRRIVSKKLRYYDALKLIVKASILAIIIFFLLVCVLVLDNIILPTVYTNKIANYTANNREKKVNTAPIMSLMLLPYQPELPHHKIAAKAIKKEFEKATDSKFNLYFEYLDLHRFPSEEYQKELFKLYAAKYSNKPIKVVLIANEITLQLWLKYRGDILPNTPVVFYDGTCQSSTMSKLPHDVTGICSVIDYTKSVEWILQVRPSIKEIVLVHGVGMIEHEEQFAYDALRNSVPEQKKFTEIYDLSLPEIKNRLANLPKNSIVVYGLISEDVNGNQYHPLEALQALTEVSAVPILSGYDQFIGTGTLGGYMYSINQQAKEAVKIGLSIIQGKAVSDIPVSTDKGNKFIFDYQVLRHWHIPLSVLPPDSIVENRKYSVWELYRLQIIAIAVGFVVLILIVIFLLNLTRQLNIARLAFKHLNDSLEIQIQERTKALRESNDRLQGEIAQRAEAEAERERLIAKLDRLSHLDSLTSIANRRSFDLYLGKEWARHRRHKLPLSLILGDVDCFKQFNDTYGHQCGDECLQKVALALKEQTKRASDLAARYGGEEFAIILPETNLEGGVSLAKLIKNRIKALKIPHSTSLVKPFVSMTFGVATIIPTPENSPDTLIALADQALYQGKQSGRDQVVGIPNQEYETSPETKI